MTTQPNLRRGAEAAKEASKGGNFARTEFFKMEDGKTAYLRFLTDVDDWITVQQHQMIKTKGKPEGFTGNWPERMGAVCRNDEAFSHMYEDCYICEFIVDGDKVKKPSARTWALACLREEVIGDGSADLGGAEWKGKRLGFRDVTREVTIKEKDSDTEKVVIEKAIVVVNMGYKNFFSVLEGYAGKNGTVLDRDFWIRRSGADLSTQYQIISEDPIMVEGEVFDLRDDKFMSRYQTNLDLVGEIVERSSDEFYARFFDPRFSAADSGEVKATGAAPEAKPEVEVTPERMGALVGRVRGYGDAATQDEAPSEAPEGAAAEAAPSGMKDFG